MQVRKSIESACARSSAVQHEKRNSSSYSIDAVHCLSSQAIERTFVKSGTCVLSTFQIMAKFLTFSETRNRVSSMTMHCGSCRDERHIIR